MTTKFVLGLFADGGWQIVAASALFLIGLLLIIKGGNWFVDAASWMAEASGIPKFIVGATIVSVATTLPELIVSCFAAAKGSAYSAMAVGNAIGSVSANTGLIMGASLLILPIAIRRKEISVKGFLMVFSVLCLTLLCWDGAFTPFEAALILLLFIAFIAENLHAASRQKEQQEREKIERKKLWKNLLFFVVGAAALAYGSTLLVDNGEFLAKAIGVDDRIIAITLVAIGTSLPELVTAITALVKKQGTMSVGNILGANIIDVTIILPACAFISGGTLHIANLESVRIDMPICLAETVLAVVPTLIFKKFTRWQAFAMLALYVSYIVYSCALA